MSARDESERTWYQFVFRAVAFVVFLFVAYCSFFALVCRIDGEEEFHAVLTMDILLGVPVAICVFLAFLGRAGTQKNWRRNLLTGFAIASAVGAAVAILFTGWHCRQIAARAGPGVLLEFLGEFLGA